VDERKVESAAETFFPDARILRQFPMSENHVYEVSSLGRAYILRITPKDHRTLRDVRAELAVVRALVARAFPAAAPVATREQRGVVETDMGWACAFESAPGAKVEAFGEDWTEAFFIQWGETIGMLHRSASDLPEVQDRFAWHEDPTVRSMPIVLAEEERASDEHARLFKKLESVPAHDLTLVHGDLGLSNFHRSKSGSITVFDFDDCCRHLALYDVAVALWPLRNRDAEERSRYLTWLLSGYQRQVELREDWKTVLQLLFDWRNLYLFTHNLKKWGSSPDSSQVAWRETMRRQIASPVNWV
jgi:Ser/Thr protein kinase RdoA (MazF antagonist)